MIVIIDRGLNDDDDDKYIVPGLRDIGNKYFADNSINNLIRVYKRWNFY